MKLLPPEHPDAPKYWMLETSGELAAAVNRYLDRHINRVLRDPSGLEQRDIDLIKAYLWQWVNSPLWAPSGSLQALRMMVATIQTQNDISRAITAAIRLEMDPL